MVEIALLIFNEVEVLSSELFFDTAYTLHINILKAIDVGDNANNLEPDMYCSINIKKINYLGLCCDKMFVFVAMKFFLC
ncbi:MAG: hypothetical protein L6U99_06410 [Clostridium sp.]|nr:MAG: hypothetical protein L6U99_06410 [Clostridium sp.]